MRSGTELAREIQLTDWSTAGNLSNRSSELQIPRDICTRFGRYLYSTRCSWIIINNYPAKSRGISSDTKIRRYSARLSRIIVLLFNKLITKLVTFLNLSVDIFSHFFFPYPPLSDKFALLFMPLCQCMWGRYKGENMSNYTWTNSKWRPFPVNCDSFLIPNLVGTYLCGAKN